MPYRWAGARATRSAILCAFGRANRRGRIFLDDLRNGGGSAMGLRPADAKVFQPALVRWFHSKSAPGRCIYTEDSVPEATPQADLFEKAPNLPEGMRYAVDLISLDEERELVEALPALRFKEFEFHGFLGKRRTVSFGWHYDFNGGGLKQAGQLPDFLLPLRKRAAEFANLEPQALEHVLLTEYRPGAGIGWHRDRPQFGDVIGISLLASCTFRLRRKMGAAWMRRSLAAAPRSAYLLRGASRTEWEHSIPPLETLRYSVTFRTLRETPPRSARSRRAHPSTIEDT